MAFESVLHHDQIISILKKLSDSLQPILVIYNKYRNVYIFYSRQEVNSEYLKKAEQKILNENTDSCLLDAGANYRVIKCNHHHVKKNQKYFSF